MRGSSLGLVVLGVVIILLGLANHFTVRANPIAHLSIVLGVLGLVVAAAGLLMGSRGVQKA